MNKRAIATALFLAAAAARLPAQHNIRRPRRGISDFDTTSFLLDGKRVLHLGAEVNYFRLPRSEWEDRLVQTRLAGFNMVETAVPWNLHEPARGQFNTEGVADLPAFLDLCHKLKLHVFLRVGPYVGAVITNGGLPAWLSREPRTVIRSPRGPFLTHVRAYWDKLLPLVASRLVPKGPVVLVQVEHDYRGREHSYLLRLYENASMRGITVPIVLSGTNPSKDFLQANVSDRALYFTSELRPSLPMKWGQPWYEARHFEGILFDAFARGVDGYSLAGWTGGTNSVVLPASSYPTRYESHATGILEGGTLTPVFHAAKQANFFARALEDVLANAKAVPMPADLNTAFNREVLTHFRADDRTEIMFLRHRYGKGKTHMADPRTGETFSPPVDVRWPTHLVFNHPLSPKTTLAVSSAQVLTIQKQAGRILLVVYAPYDTTAKMVFRTSKQPTTQAGREGLSWNASKKQLVLTWNHLTAKDRADFVFTDDVRVHVVAIDVSQIATTWILDGIGVLLGAPGVGPHDAASGIELRFPLKRHAYALRFYPHAGRPAPAPSREISEPRFNDDTGRLDFTVSLLAGPPPPSFLQSFEMAPIGPEISPGFDASSWETSGKALPMGEGRYGWYRCSFEVTRAQQRTVRFANLADGAFVYLNGEYVGKTPTKRPMDAPRKFPHRAYFPIAVREGTNVLTCLVKNWGRYRNYGVHDLPLRDVTGWGLLDRVTLDTRVLSNWQSREGLSPVGRRFAWTSVSAAGPPARWYRTRFKTPKWEGYLVGRIRLRGLGYGSVWVNGQYVGQYNQQGYDAGRGVYIPPQFLRPDNEVIVLEEDGKTPGLAQVRYDPKASYVPVVLKLR